MHVLPHSWGTAADTRLVGAHFVKHKLGKGPQKAALAGRGKGGEKRGEWRNAWVGRGGGGGRRFIAVVCSHGTRELCGSTLISFGACGVAKAMGCGEWC